MISQRYLPLQYGDPLFDYGYYRVRGYVTVLEIKKVDSIIYYMPMTDIQ